jgi:hypothetical protein
MVVFSFQGIEVVRFRLVIVTIWWCSRLRSRDVKGVFDVPEMAQDEHDLAAEKDAGGEAIRLASLPENCR